MIKLAQRNEVVTHSRDKYYFHVLSFSRDKWWHEVGVGWQGTYVGNINSVNFLKEL